MGVWGAGNFDSDYALDFVADLSGQVDKEMGAPSCVEDTDLVMTAVAVRLALIQHCHASRPEKRVIEELRDKVLAIYDAEIDGLQPKPGFKAKRRKVIQETFKGFLAVLKKK